MVLSVWNIIGLCAITSITTFNNLQLVLNIDNWCNVTKIPYKPLKWRFSMDCPL